MAEHKFWLEAELSVPLERQVLCRRLWDLTLNRLATLSKSTEEIWFPETFCLNRTEISLDFVETIRPLSPQSILNAKPARWALTSEVHAEGSISFGGDMQNGLLHLHRAKKPKFFSSILKFNWARPRCYSYLPPASKTKVNGNTICYSWLCEKVTGLAHCRFTPS